LQEAQQLDLQCQGNVADLVQEQGAARRHLDLAGRGLNRAGESAAFKAEQLGLQRFSGIAAQLMATNGPDARRLFSCTARASSSLPVPLAPSSMTDTSAGATRSMVRATLSMRARR
jgi:hypothetical protein